MAFPDAWQELALITIVDTSNNAWEYAAITETIDINQPDYPGESIPDIAGDRVWKQSPEEDGEITLELYPIDVNKADNTSLFMQFSGGTAQGSEPRETATSWDNAVNRVRDMFMVAILWTNDIKATDATAATTAIVISSIDDDGITIGSIDGTTATITIHTSGDHGLSIGDRIRISGTTNYNGLFTVTTVTDSDTITISSTNHNFDAEAVGTITSRFTVDTSTAHGFSAGDRVTISSTTNFNGTFQISSVTDADTFVVLSTEHNFASEASGTLGTDSLRFCAVDCRIISNKTSFTDGIVKSTVTLKFPAITAGRKNWRWDSGSQTAIDNLRSSAYSSSWTWP